MNPNTVIKPWLRAVGKQYGINQAHEYRWTDADTRQQDMYFAYRIIGSRPTQDGVQTTKVKTGATNTDSKEVTWQRWTTRVRIDLWRSENGMAELSACCIAATENSEIQRLFAKDGCSFLELVSMENLTVETDQLKTEDIHHRMVVDFYDQIQVSFTKINNVVNEINVTLGNWDS